MTSRLPAIEVDAFPFFPRVVSKAAGKTLVLFSVLLLLAGATTARGQSALDGFDPRPNDLVRVIVVQPDGKILIGGDFTTLAPNGGVTVTRNGIARLNPDGTLDPAFNPNANNGVLSIALQGDGKILVGGVFTNIGGQARNRLARLDPVTGLADSFDPNASSNVLTIALQPDGKVLAGGAFTSIGGQTRNRLARIDPVTGQADSFNPNANNLILGIALQPDGKILACGFFTSIGGQTRNHIARLNATSGLADLFNPNANNAVVAIAIQSDGKILLGGDFNGANGLGGQARNFLARVEVDGRVDRTLNLNINSYVVAIAVQPDGKSLIGGDFTSLEC